MRILYGVQATGQGHISRARAMSQAFTRYDVEVDWLFSGRSREKLFDMEPFGHYKHRRGLTFTTRAGQLRRFETLVNNDFPQFLRDVRNLDLSPYDLVVTDYEPVVAWSARRAGVQSIGIGHQYAFGTRTPVSGADPVSRAIMRCFAPVTVPVGLHWYPYAHNVLPPILDLPPLSGEVRGHILVYLPFEDQAEVTRVLQDIPGLQFIQYANGLQTGITGNVICRPTSTATFKQDLGSASGVICNSGFELISECLQWGKPVLTRPLSGQMEQLSNAEALQRLGYASVMTELSEASIRDWLLAERSLASLEFPDVAAVLARWLSSGAQAGVESLWYELWRIPPGQSLSWASRRGPRRSAALPVRQAG